MSFVLSEPTPPRPTLNRALVVAAAARLIDAEGVDALSMTRLARSLGVTQPALYNHVRGVADCLAGVALQAREELLRSLRRAARGRSQDDAVVAVATAWRRYAKRCPGRYAATDRHPVAGHAELEEAVGRIVELLRRVVATYEVTAVEAEHGAWSLRAALHGFVALEAEHGHPRSLRLDDSFSHLLALLCQGFRHAADRAAAPPLADRTA